jgi:hypothetical protein
LAEGPSPNDWSKVLNEAEAVLAKAKTNLK